MKKKLFGAVIALVVVAMILVTMTLMTNKAKMAAQSDSFTLTVYPVSVLQVSQRNVTDQFSQTGVIAANQDVEVISEIQGKVIAVFVQVGSPVATGSVIAKVDDELPRANYLASQVSYEKARRDLERYESLRRQEIISEMELEAVRLSYKAAEAQYTAARRQYTNSTITAPIGGQISAKTIEVGTMVSPGGKVANIVDIAKLKLKLNLSEVDVFRIQVGDPVTITTDVYPGVQYAGRVATISAKGDEAHTYPVEIGFANNRRYPLKASMFGKVAFLAKGATDALLIPREALVDSVQHPEVYVVKDGRVQLRKIVIGREIGSELTVIQGLTAGETVVVNGQNNLTNGVKVTVVK